VLCAGRPWSLTEASFYKLHGGEELLIEHSSILKMPLVILVRASARS